MLSGQTSQPAQTGSLADCEMLCSTCLLQECIYGGRAVVPIW